MPTSRHSAGVLGSQSTPQFLADSEYQRKRDLTADHSLTVLTPFLSLSCTLKMASASGKSSLALLKAWSAEQLKEGRVEAHLRALLSSLRHLRLVAALLHAGEPVPPFSNLPIFIYLYSTVIRSGGRGGLSQFLLLLDLDALHFLPLPRALSLPQTRRSSWLISIIDRFSFDFFKYIIIII